MDRGLEKLRIIEAAQNSLRAFVEALALFLELAKNLHPRFDAGGLLG